MHAYYAHTLVRGNETAYYAMYCTAHVRGNVAHVAPRNAPLHYRACAHLCALAVMFGGFATRRLTTRTIIARTCDSLATLTTHTNFPHASYYRTRSGVRLTYAMRYACALHPPMRHVAYAHAPALRTHCALMRYISARALACALHFCARTRKIFHRFYTAIRNTKYPFKGV